MAPTPTYPGPASGRLCDKVKKVPRQTFLHRVIAPALPDRVWTALQRPQSWERIGGVRNVEHATFDGAGNITGYRFSVALGGNMHAGSATRSAVTPGRRVLMHVDTDQLKGEIDVELDQTADQTAVTVTMTVESKGFVAAMLFPVITGAIASGFNDEVEKFTRALSDGPISSSEELPDEVPDQVPDLGNSPDLGNRPDLGNSGGS